MTHNDIYTKFMIEYDKANVTSSYPSLTQYEVATILDKAYNALIAQKVTGNNPRRSTFEADTKAVSDLQGLVITDEDMPLEPSENVQNVTYCLFEDLEETDGFLYFVGGTVKYYPAYEDIKSYNKSNKRFTIPISDLKSIELYDNVSGFNFTYKDSEKETGERLSYSLEGGDFPLSKDNITIPFIISKSAIENDQLTQIIIQKSNSILGSDDPNSNKIYVQAIVHSTGNPYDNNMDRNDQITLVSHDMAKKSFVTSYNMPWVKAPLCYIEDNKFFVVSDPIKHAPAYLSLTYIKKPKSFVSGNSVDLNSDFELNDTMAEELISLAITFALENVESPRLNSHVQLNTLES